MADGKNLVTSHGKGRELCDLLRRELCVPDHALSFSVSFGIDDFVRVKCKYLPKESGSDG